MRRAAAQAAISGLTGPDFFKMRQIWRSESPCRTASTDTSARSESPSRANSSRSRLMFPVSYTHLTLPTTPYV